MFTKLLFSNLKNNRKITGNMLMKFLPPNRTLQTIDI